MGEGQVAQSRPLDVGRRGVRQAELIGLLRGVSERLLRPALMQVKISQLVVGQCGHIGQWCSRGLLGLLEGFQLLGCARQRPVDPTRPGWRRGCA